MVDIILWTLLIVIIIILLQYNKLIKLRNQVKKSESGIDVYLNQRFDLIPNLVECVKSYTKHESQVFEEIVKLRNQCSKNSRTNLKQASKLNNGINTIMAIAEGYPELKASEQYLTLQKSLIKMESQLQAARRIYNNDVMEYNTKIETIPFNIIAKIFGFNQVEFFEIEEYKRENIVIKEEQ